MTVRFPVMEVMELQNFVQYRSFEKKNTLYRLKRRIWTIYLETTVNLYKKKIIIKAGNRLKNSGNIMDFFPMQKNENLVSASNYNVTIFKICSTLV